MIFLVVMLITFYLISLGFVLGRKALRLLHCRCRKYYLIVLFYVLTKMTICGILSIQIAVGIPNQWADLGEAHVEMLFKNAIVLGD